MYPTIDLKFNGYPPVFSWGLHFRVALRRSIHMVYNDTWEDIKYALKRFWQPGLTAYRKALAEQTEFCGMASI